MMHDSVTNPSQSTNYYSPDDIPSSNHSKSQVNLGAGPREMLSSATSRRSQATLPNASRWRINSSGQLVDAAASEWDLEDEMVKLQITDGSGDPNSQLHTPPQPKPNAANIVAPHETSPLETSSETSVGSNSPSNLDQHGNFASHSRGSSADTTGSAANQTVRPAPFTPLKVVAVGESRNRPHSYSGGISAADLSRLQQAGGGPSTRDTWSSPNGTPERPSQADPPAYASLASQNGFRPQDPTQMISSAVGDDLQVNYQLQQRRFAPMAQAGGQAPQFPPSNRPANIMANQPFRQARGFNPQVQLPNVVTSPTNFAYPPTIHPAPLNLTNAQQQIYDMMLPTPPLENPAMARLQQQTAFRPGHQHSASDPASLRDPATLAMINNSMQAFAAGQMYPPTIAPPPALSMFANQFYGTPPDNYPAELAMMARLQAQYTGGPYGMPVPGQAMSMPTATGATSGGNSPGNGPSANNRKLGLYKTELCRSWEEKGTCRYGSKCQFAHGEDELRKVQRHPKYKTEICRTFWVSGSCPYGKRCCFIHTELPASGAPPGAEGVPPPANPDGRARSASTNSDPNEVSTSLLARISAKRSQEGTLNSGSGSVSTTPPSATFSGRPGALRVDTSVIDTANTKQNKSAYPTFAHNGVLMPAGEDAPSMSPGPVTAAPDFGRHTNARIDIVGTQPRISKNTNANSNGRHSFSGSDVQLDFNNSVTPTAAQSQSSQFTSSPPEPSRTGRINGHVRSGSAGNWGAATRTSHLTAYPLSSIPAGELKASSPWADYVGSRIAEKTWG